MKTNDFEWEHINPERKERAVQMLKEESDKYDKKLKEMNKYMETQVALIQEWAMQK